MSNIKQMMQEAKQMSLFHVIMILGWFGLLFLVLINYLFLVNHLIILLAIVTLIYSIIYKARPYISLDLIVLIAFSVLYFYFYTRYNITSPRIYMIYLFGPAGMFLIGMIMQSKYKDNMFKSVMLMVAFGFLVYGILNMVHYFTIYGIYSNWRLAIEFWTGYDVVATLQGIYFTPVVSLLFFNLVYMSFRKHLFLKVLMIIGIFFGLYTSVVLQNRTLFIITAMMLVLMFILDSILSKGKLIIPAIIVTLFLSLVVLSYRMNLFEVKSFVEESLWYSRVTTSIESGLTNDPRFEVYGKVYDQLFDYPYGGYQLDIGELDYAHNIYLDVLYVGGIYPFFTLLLYTLVSLFTWLRLLLAKKVTNEIKILYSSVFLGLMINFMTEPILDGVPYIFLVFCFMNGLVTQYVIKYYKTEKLEKKVRGNLV